MSGVFLNIDPPHRPASVYPPPRLWCEGRTHSLGGEVMGVNSSEDARHCYVLYICKYFVVPPQRINNLQKPTLLSAFFQFTDSLMNSSFVFTMLCYCITAEHNHLPSLLVGQFCFCGYSYDNSCIKDRSHRSTARIFFFFAVVIHLLTSMCRYNQISYLIFYFRFLHFTCYKIYSCRGRAFSTFDFLF